MFDITDLTTIYINHDYVVIELDIEEITITDTDGNA